MEASAAERHAAGDADAQHVDPSLLEIEQMGVEQRTATPARAAAYAG